MLSIFIILATGFGQYLTIIQALLTESSLNHEMLKYYRCLSLVWEPIHIHILRYT